MKIAIEFTTTELVLIGILLDLHVRRLRGCAMKHCNVQMQAPGYRKMADIVQSLSDRMTTNTSCASAAQGRVLFMESKRFKPP
jgi:hypothetical protein